MHVGEEEMEFAYNLVGNKQIVRDSWIHEKVNFTSKKILPTQNMSFFVTMKK